jgi:hypothetical protein
MDHKEITEEEQHIKIKASPLQHGQEKQKLQEHTGHDLTLMHWLICFYRRV